MCLQSRSPSHQNSILKLNCLSPLQVIDPEDRELMSTIHWVTAFSPQKDNNRMNLHLLLHLNVATERCLRLLSRGLRTTTQPISFIGSTTAHPSIHPLVVYVLYTLYTRFRLSSNEARPHGPIYRIGKKTKRHVANPFTPLRT